MSYSVVVGNVYDGFQVVGPFESIDEAGKFANGGRVPEEMLGTVMELVAAEDYNPGPD